ncbi:MAG: glycosyltransferase family 4 protein [Bacilli bacterium]|jgi:glycosyltransferase involved in cell wall biosynthesis
MKILIVCQFYYPERFTVSDLAAALVRRGHSVNVVTGKPNYCFNQILPEYRNVHNEVIEGVNVHRVNLYPRKQSRLSIYRNYLSFHRNAKAYVRKIKEKYDVVLSISLSPVISIAPAVLYAKKHHVKHVLHCLDLWPESTVVTGAVKKDSLIYKILFNWSRKLYLGCDRILVSSPSFIEYFRDVLKIDNRPFANLPQPALSSKEKLDPLVFSKPHNFVYVGNIGRLQLIENLAKAGQLLANRGDFELHFVGMGQESEKLKTLIANNRLEGIVTYHGPLMIEQAERFYQNADALIVALKNQGTVGKTIPNKLIHYLKSGKPIIGVISGDGRDVLIASGGAILSDENPQAISQAMSKMMELSKSEKDRMGILNRQYFDDNYELDKVAQLLEEELLTAIKS